MTSGEFKPVSEFGKRLIHHPWSLGGGTVAFLAGIVLLQHHVQVLLSEESSDEAREEARYGVLADCVVVAAGLGGLGHGLNKTVRDWLEARAEARAAAAQTTAAPPQDLEQGEADEDADEVFQMDASSSDSEGVFQMDPSSSDSESEADEAAAEALQGHVAATADATIGAQQQVDSERQAPVLNRSVGVVRMSLEVDPASSSESEEHLQRTTLATAPPPGQTNTPPGQGHESS